MIRASREQGSMIQKAYISERLVRTIYWTFFVFSVGFTSYGFIVETFGFGLFLRSDSVPKLHMRGEAYLAVTMSSAATFGLLAASILIRRWSRTLLGVGLTGCAYWFAYFAMPRF